MTVRAKFHCQAETRHSWNSDVKSYRFQAVYDQGLAEEDRGFAKATPTGTLEIQVDNPNVRFDIGSYYYLDFTRVEQ